MAIPPERELPVQPTSLRGLNGARVEIIEAASVADAAVQALSLLSAEEMLSRVVEFSGTQHLVVIVRRPVAQSSLRVVG
jgi:hypothetical protein